MLTEGMLVESGSYYTGEGLMVINRFASYWLFTWFCEVQT